MSFTNKDHLGGSASEKDSVAALNQQKLKSTDSKENADEVKQPQSFEGRDEKAASLPTDQITQLIETARDQAKSELAAEMQAFDDKLAEYNDRLTDSEAQLKAKDEEIAKIKDQAEAERSQLINTFCLTGGQGFQPKQDSAAKSNDNRSYSASSVIGRYANNDLLKEYNRILERDCVGYQVSTPSGNVMSHKDTRHADGFFAEHSKQILRAVEHDMKSSGFLQGGIASRDNTIPGDVPFAFLDVASSVGRLTHHEELIHWQFAQRKSDPSIAVEQTGRFPRLEYGAEADDFADYILGSSTPTLQTSTEALRGSSVPIEISELGLGRPGTNLKPISISEIITSNNIFDAMSAVNMRLVKSYNRAVDKALRSLLHTTSRGGYVSANGLVETAGEVASGGQINQKFLSFLYGYLSAQNVPKLADGCYFLVMPPQSYSVLREDLIDRERFIDPGSMDGLLNALRESYGEDLVKRVSGYQGKIEGFHVFQAGSYGTGLPGTEGVQTETLNGTSVTTRNCYAFGVQTVGVLEAMPFTIRQRSENSFGRNTDFIWLAHEGYGALDVDPLRTRLGWETPGDSASEQLRVFDIRCADVAV